MFPDFHPYLLGAGPLAGRADGSSFSVVWVVGTAVAVSVVWLVIFYGDRIRSRIHLKTSQTEDLFLSLCEAHQLDRTEREFLARLADGKKLPRPAMLFVEPMHLRSTAESGGPFAAAASALLQKLFEPTPV